MSLYYSWLKKNASTDDCIPGAFYNSQNKQWVIYDSSLLSEYIQKGD